MSNGEHLKRDLKPVEEALAGALIQICYGFDTSPYLQVLEESTDQDFPDEVKNVLHPVLACLSTGMAVRLLRTRYGDDGNAIITEIIDRIYQSVMETETNESAAGYITELIDYYSRLAFSVKDQNICDKIIDPVAEMLSEIQVNNEMCQYLQAFLIDFARQAKQVIDQAEEEYDYSP